MQPKTYIYSKPAFFRLILSGFHFTEKRKKLSFGNKTRTNAAICQFLLSPVQTGHPEGKETVPEDLYKYSGTALSDVSYQK